MRDELQARLERACDEVMEELVADLRAGVSTPSVNPALPGGMGEGAFQELFASCMERAGCCVELITPDLDALSACYPEAVDPAPPADFARRPNVVAWLPSAESTDGPSAYVVLNSHADTVAPGETASWPHGPFAAAMVDGHVHGLGAADAKGCLYAFLGAVRILRAAGLRPRREVQVQAVVDEEHRGLGVLDLVRRGYRGWAAVVGEPTSLEVCPGSRGSMSLTLVVSGRKAHPGLGWMGVSAPRKAWMYVEAVDALRRELDLSRPHPLWEDLPEAHVWNLMAFNTGAPKRAVPDHCEVKFSIGLIGNEDAATMRRLVEERLAEVTAGDDWLRAHPPEVRWSPLTIRPAVTPPSHPAVAALAEAVEASTGSPARIQAFSAATDARHLVHHGGMAAMNFGPGDIQLCHGPEERLAVADLRKAALSVARFLARACGVDDHGW